MYLHRPIHIEIILTRLPWQTDHCTPSKMAFKGLVNAKVAFPMLCSNLLCAYCLKKLSEQAPTRTRYIYC